MGKVDIDLDWQLEGCCDTVEYIFIALYFTYGVLIHILYHRTNVLYPFKLLGVFVHEMGHASATWLTCGKVQGIEVYNNEGGITKFTGGVRYVMCTALHSKFRRIANCQLTNHSLNFSCCVIPAGYVGGAFWGAAFVALSGHRIGATVAACIVSAALIIALWCVFFVCFPRRCNERRTTATNM